jgi:hypothetical protein
MRPEEIAELLSTDPESVIVAREHALEQLADELGMGDVGEIDDVRARLAELPGEAWTPPAEPAEAEAVEPEDEPERVRRPPLTVVEDEPIERDEPEAADEPAAKRRSRLPLLLTLLAVTAIALIVVLASNGPDDGRTTKSTPAPAPAAKKPEAAPAAAPATATKPVPLTVINRAAAGATATAALAQGGKRLELNVKGLPDPGASSYQVWLYDNVIESRSLSSARDTSFGLDLRLPANASHFTYVDISLEPRDGNPNHSGESFLRVPLAKLAP